MTNKVVLHIGLPKAASTTIQMWAKVQNGALLERGVNYPIVDETRHQGLVRGLMNGDHVWLKKTLDANTSPTLFLSAEGLSWHLQDYPEAHLSGFRDVLARYQLEVLFIGRPFKQWIRSFHRQLMLNPTNQELDYGTALSINEFTKLPRVEFMQNHVRLLEKAQCAYGSKRMTSTTTEHDWTSDVCNCLSLDDMTETLKNFPRENEGFNADLTEFARQINGMKVSEKLRYAAFKLLQDHAQSTIDVIEQQFKKYGGHQIRYSDDLRHNFENLAPVSASQQLLRTALLTNFDG
jgi:hypothetical protein